MEVCQPNCQRMVLDAVLSFRKIFLLGEFEFLIVSCVLEKSTIKTLTRFRKSERKKSAAISPDEVSVSFFQL